jgi:hypothetical protein
MNNKEATERAELILLFKAALDEPNDLSHEAKAEIETELYWLEKVEPETLKEASTGTYFEVDNLLGLINDSHVEPNYFNTFEWLTNFFVRINDPKTELIIDKKLETLGVTYPSLKKHFDTEVGELDLDSIRNLNEQFDSSFSLCEAGPLVKKQFQFGSPIDMFIGEIYEGRIPSPEFLAMVANCFSLYYKAQGELTLEEVFFGKPKKRSGNYSARKSKNDNYAEFHWQLIEEKRLVKKINITDFACSYLKEKEKNNSISPITCSEDNIESYLTGYYRWRKKFRVIK